ncbi:MAG: S8 family serine peptidase [Armatimonadetes bacterium]|nr:S8 family serine peptidase [Armatimonadota bacterium]
MRILQLLLAFTIWLLLAGCGNLSDPQSSTGSVSSGSDTPSARQASGTRMIVVLKSGRADEVASAHGLVPSRRYSKALNGFAAPGNAEKMARLRQDPRVAYVEIDPPVYLVGKPAGGGGKTPPPPPPPQVTPTGVDRVDADMSATARINGVDERVPVGVAVIDTGIDLDHPDLVVRHGYNFVRDGKPAEDDEGHGSHVAGTIGARDNGVGVVGVAPGATVWAVKVLDAQGRGWGSDVIAGVDWVARNAAANDIRVANMSLGMPATQAVDDAVRNAIVNSGVTFVLAAGNSGADAVAYSPARVAEAITVSAIADTDGKPGRLGADFSFTLSLGGSYVVPDDCFARVESVAGGSYSYTNYGPGVDIAAPGSAIYSTYKAAGYQTLTGTSMAAPHVAGAAALLLAQNPALTPAEVAARLTDPVAGTFDYGYKSPGNDPDGIQEPLLNVRGF